MLSGLPSPAAAGSASAQSTYANGSTFPLRRDSESSGDNKSVIAVRLWSTSSRADAALAACARKDKAPPPPILATPPIIKSLHVPLVHSSLLILSERYNVAAAADHRRGRSGTAPVDFARGWGLG